ncbi:MAG: MBL fold metallo-hydrolase [Candidatus Freyarchaeum deiterrae]
MKVIPLAFESLGTRSMATFVETKDCSILIDPGVALGPLRYGLEPHEIELERLLQHWSEIKSYSENSNILVITHYHYDHYNPKEIEIYRGKTVLIKHPEENINFSQKKRSKYFLSQIKNLPSEIRHSDGQTFEFGNTTIIFSEPVYHGTDSKLGYVTEVGIKEGKDTFLHTSDVEGPSLKPQNSFIIEQDPDIIFCDGPMTYMPYNYSKQSLQDSIRNLLEIMDKTHVKKLILDHHLLRDLDWKESVKDLFPVAEEKGMEIISAAEFRGSKNDLLEARRKELWKQHPPQKTSNTQ